MLFTYEAICLKEENLPQRGRDAEKFLMGIKNLRGSVALRENYSLKKFYV